MSSGYRFEKGVAQPAEGFASIEVETVVTDVDARQNELGVGGSHQPGLRHDLFYRAGPAIAPRDAGRAEGALPVAPVLNLEPPTGPADVRP